MSRRREAWSSPGKIKGSKKRNKPDVGWNSRIQSIDIPRYNSLSDRYNPFTHTKKFAKRFANQKRLEEIERRERFSKRQKLLTAIDAKKSAMAMSSTQYGEHANESVSFVADEIRNIIPRRSSHRNAPSTGSPFVLTGRGGMTTPHGVLSFQRTKSSDPSSELEVLKSILLREGYLERLHHLARRRGDQTALRGEVVDVLDLIRMSTVETIETILKWKRTLVKPYPFVWNGVNYLLKIPSDLDFLSRFAEIETWLGFTLVRNPFIITVCLDKRPSTPQVANSLSVHMSSKRGNKVGGSEKFHQIGSIEPAVYLQAQNFAAKEQNRLKPSRQKGSLGGALGGISGAAYDTPIVNDTDLLPASNKASEIAEESMEKAKQEAKIAAERYVKVLAFWVYIFNCLKIVFIVLNDPSNTHTHTHTNLRPFPTHVGDVDMIRIRAAEKILLEEEAIQGRMMRDEYGRLVPEALRAAIDAANDAANDYTSKVVQGRSRNVKEVFEVEKQREFKNVENASSSNVIGASKGKYI